MSYNPDVRPTIFVDVQADLTEAGIPRNTPATRRSFLKAFTNAADGLGCWVTTDPAEQNPRGLPREIIQALWQEAHDSIRESRPEQWVKDVPDRTLRIRRREIIRD